jgi:hypothetical protein
MNNTNFIRFAAVCGFITVFTTLGLHLFFPAYATDFEDRLLLHSNSVYFFNRWWIIIHCLLALIAMSGFAVFLYKRSPGFIMLGYTFFCTFAIAEVLRQMLVLFYLNGLRVKYLAETDEAVKSILKVSLDNFGLLSNAVFGLFILAFGLGNLFYGLSIWKEKGLGKVLSIMLIIWSFGSFTALGNEFFNNDVIAGIIEKYNYIYQPFMRFLLPLWLLKNINTKTTTL